MNGKDRKCLSCKMFVRYYTKGRRQFINAKCGWCNSSMKVVKEICGCENYIPAPQKNTITEDAKKTLSYLLDEISTIRKVMEAEIENGKDV